LHPGLDREALLDRVLREEARAEHHARVRGVRAARDRGDHHRAVAELELAAVELDGGGLRDRAGRFAAERARVGERLTVVGARALLEAVVLRRQRADERAPPSALGLGERDAILRALGAGDRRDDRGEVELEGGAEARLRALLGVEEALLLQVALDQLDLRLVAVREA